MIYFRFLVRRGRPKNSWKDAVDRDSIALGIGN